jgi:branched-chain amino acid aminotransferase
MEDRDGWIWLDGTLVPWREARLHVLSHTLHHGMGIFEGVRAYEASNGPAIFRLQDHTARFARSAHILQMKLPFDSAALNAAQLEVVAANRERACYIRPIAFYGGERVGVSARGNTVHVAIAVWPWEAYLGADAKDQGIRVKTSSFSRHHINSVMVHAKACGHYINSMLANHEAVSQGYGECLMLDVHGSIMLLAQDMGMQVVERKITRDDIYCADEAFFTGTAAEITPIRELDDRRIGGGTPGSVTRSLQEAYAATVTGRNPKRASWLSPVRP